MPLTILSVAYPLAPVRPDPVGGAEAILARLDRGIVAAGHRSLVIAQDGSAVAGDLVALPAPAGALDAAAVAKARVACRDAIVRTLARHPVDLVHLHGIDFPTYLPPPGPPVLATLHLPPDWYPPDALRPGRPDTWVHCVSDSQHAACPPSPALLPPIPNGVDPPPAGVRVSKRPFVLFLGRLCPEKGVHLAMEAAARAGRTLLVGGEAFAYPDHLRYVREMVEPRVGPGCRLLGPVGGARKRRLLAGARCVVIPSLAAETSSLVAREALAAGTPVAGFRIGALPEIVEDGVTGYLAAPGDVAGLAEAIGRAEGLDGARCRAAGAARGADAMVAAYLALYERLVGGRTA